VCNVATVRQLIDKVATRLRMEGGTAMQTYSEDAILMGLQHKFTVLFDEFWFPQFMTYQEPYTLDGTLGVVTSDLSKVLKRFEDIRYINSAYSMAPLPRAPDSVRVSDVQQPCVQPYKDKKKVFRILPTNSTGSIAITYRTLPDQFDNDDDVIDMDEQLMILGTCFDMLEDDSLNPGASDKFKSMFDSRVKQVTANQHNMTMTGAPMQTFPLNRWV